MKTLLQAACVVACLSPVAAQAQQGFGLYTSEYPTQEFMKQFWQAGAAIDVIKMCKTRSPAWIAKADRIWTAATAKHIDRMRMPAGSLDEIKANSYEVHRDEMTELAGPDQNRCDIIGGTEILAVLDDVNAGRQRYP